MKYSTGINVSITFSYDPFGMLLVGRSWSVGSEYRYGFNGKEQDDEVSGNGNQYDYGFRIYNPKLGKFLSVDPLTSNYSYLTPYQFASNSPVSGIDVDGLEFYYTADGTLIGQVGTDNSVRLINDKDIEKGKQYVEWAIDTYNNPERTEAFAFNNTEALKYSTDVGLNNQELNVRAMLTIIKKHEGGEGSEGYTTWNGGEKFTKTDDHPGYNKRGNSAAGAFQILKGSWNDENTGKKYRTKYGIVDFSAKSQDRFAVATIVEKTKSIELIKSGDFSQAMVKMSNEWRFLPGELQQGNTDATTIMTELKTAISNELKGYTDLATPQGELLNGF